MNWYKLSVVSESFQRRFSGIGRLFSQQGLDQLRRAHVCVIGAGGVGSWTAEALVRSGIGTLTLVDLDDVCMSNVNRQIHALDGEFGKPKVEAMERRLRAINPECSIHAVQAFFVKSTADRILATPYAFVVDAIDNPPIKALLIASCGQRRISVITTGGAGGRRDPTALRVADLAASSKDTLLRCVRRELRKHHGFPPDGLPFGVDCVFSLEQPVYPAEDGNVCAQRPQKPDLRLDCTSGYGTASFVTGAFGFAAASTVVARLSATGGGCLPQGRELNPVYDLEASGEGRPAEGL